MPAGPLASGRQNAGFQPAGPLASSRPKARNHLHSPTTFAVTFAEASVTRDAPAAGGTRGVDFIRYAGFLTGLHEILMNADRKVGVPEKKECR